MKTRIVNKYKQPFDVYIGRGSKWGNPFKIDSANNRDTVIERYRHWITDGDGKHLLHELHELKGKILGCYCAPKPCHGDVLIELVNRYCND